MKVDRRPVGGREIEGAVVEARRADDLRVVGQGVAFLWKHAETQVQLVVVVGVVIGHERVTPGRDVVEHQAGLALFCRLAQQFEGPLFLAEAVRFAIERNAKIAAVVAQAIDLNRHSGVVGQRRLRTEQAGQQQGAQAERSAERLNGRAGRAHGRGRARACGRARGDGRGHEQVHVHGHRGDDGGDVLALLLYNRNLYTYYFLFV